MKKLPPTLTERVFDKLIEWKKKTVSSEMMAYALKDECSNPRTSVATTFNRFVPVLIQLDIITNRSEPVVSEKGRIASFVYTLDHKKLKEVNRTELMECLRVYHSRQSAKYRKTKFIQNNGNHSVIDLTGISVSKIKVGNAEIMLPNDQLVIMIIANAPTPE